MSCHCENPIDSWDRRTDVPQYGSSYIQLPVHELIPELRNDRRLLSAYVLVRYIGQPPRTFGGGAYKIETCLGFEHLVGSIYSFGYGSVKEIKES
jgi:hypothetical protein